MSDSDSSSSQPDPEPKKTKKSKKRSKKEVEPDSPKKKKKKTKKRRKESPPSSDSEDSKPAKKKRKKESKSKKKKKKDDSDKPETSERWGESKGGQQALDDELEAYQKNKGSKKMKSKKRSKSRRKRSRSGRRRRRSPPRRTSRPVYSARGAQSRRAPYRGGGRPSSGARKEYTVKLKRRPFGVEFKVTRRHTIVEEVEEDSEAYNRGVRRGSDLMAVNGKDVDEINRHDEFASLQVMMAAELPIKITFRHPMGRKRSNSRERRPDSTGKRFLVLVRARDGIGYRRSPDWHNKAEGQAKHNDVLPAINWYQDKWVELENGLWLPVRSPDGRVKLVEKHESDKRDIKIGPKHFQGTWESIGQNKFYTVEGTTIVGEDGETEIEITSKGIIKMKFSDYVLDQSGSHKNKLVWINDNERMTWKRQISLDEGDPVIFVGNKSASDYPAWLKPGTRGEYIERDNKLCLISWEKGDDDIMEEPEEIWSNNDDFKRDKARRREMMKKAKKSERKSKVSDDKKKTKKKKKKSRSRSPSASSSPERPAKVLNPGDKDNPVEV